MESQQPFVGQVVLCFDRTWGPDPLPGVVTRVFPLSAGEVVPHLNVLVLGDGQPYAPFEGTLVLLSVPLYPRGSAAAEERWCEPTEFRRVTPEGYPVSDFEIRPRPTNGRAA